MNEELPLNTSAPKAATRRASGAQHGGMTAHTNNALGNLSREEVAHGEGRAPRRSMTGLDLKLYFAPKYMANKNMYYRIFTDRDSRIEQAKDAYYEHVLDENGAKLHNKKITIVVMLVKIIASNIHLIASIIAIAPYL